MRVQKKKISLGILRLAWARARKDGGPHARDTFGALREKGAIVIIYLGYCRHNILPRVDGDFGGYILISTVIVYQLAKKSGLSMWPRGFHCLCVEDRKPLLCSTELQVRKHAAKTLKIRARRPIQSFGSFFLQSCG